MLYDYVVPSAKEHLDVDDDVKYQLSRAVDIYFGLLQSANDGYGKVSFKFFIQIWIQGDARCRTPLVQEHRRNIAAKLKRIFSISKSMESSHLTETKDGHIPFNILDVKKSLKKETYIEALLVCGICKFLLPSYEADTFIKASSKWLA